MDTSRKHELGLACLRECAISHREGMRTHRLYTTAVSSLATYSRQCSYQSYEAGSLACIHLELRGTYHDINKQFINVTAFTYKILLKVQSNMREKLTVFCYYRM